jgi:hypothetical protein
MVIIILYTKIYNCWNTTQNVFNSIQFDQQNKQKISLNKKIFLQIKTNSL